MGTIKIIARDSSSAMEEVSKKLGADAYILSTNSKDGGVEIEATNDPSELKKFSEKSKKNFSGLIQKELNNVAKFPVKNPIGSSYDSFHNQSNQSVGLDASQLSELTNNIHTLREEIKGMYITNSSGLGVEIGESTFVKLQNAGFDSSLVKSLGSSFYGLSYQKGRIAFMKSLAEQLTLNKNQNFAERVTFVNGLSGVGKTTLTAKIAANHLESSQKKIVMATLADPNDLIDDNLRHYARMLNIPVLRLTPDTLLESIYSTKDRLIIDVSLASNDVVKIIQGTREVLIEDEFASIVAIPGGSSHQFIRNQADLFKELKPRLTLTKLDECDITPREISEFFKNKMKICYLTGSKSILRGLSYCNTEILAQYLVENC